MDVGPAADRRLPLADSRDVFATVTGATAHAAPTRNLRSRIHPIVYNTCCLLRPVFLQNQVAPN